MGKPRGFAPAMGSDPDLFGAMVASFGRNLPPQLRARTLAVQGMIAFGFIAFMLFTSNPFERILVLQQMARD